MSRSTVRRCPACGEVKLFRVDYQTCCKGKITQSVSQTGTPQDESAQMLFLRKENQRLGNRIDQLKDAEGFREEVRLTIQGAVHALEPLRLIPYKRPPKRGSEIAAGLTQTY